MHRSKINGTALKALLCGLLLSGAALTQAQVAAPKPPDVRPPMPRLADGTPNLGRVELSRGYWAPQQFRDYNAILQSPAQIPYLPWAAQVAKERRDSDSRDDPNGHCLPPAGPRLMTTPYPMEILQLPEQQRIMMIFEGGAHVWREIYMDGREFPEDINPTWMGYSIGHWDGDTLVVEIRGFNEKSWLDMYGDPHTEQLIVTERFTRTDLYTLHYESTIDDPGAYSEPWVVAMDIVWDPEGEIIEYICQENNLWNGSHLLK
ncbi:MAG: hypothetical protein LBE21_01310 [Pseudomonadales bacterium]|nr:hypothetical protein [Pseudomonadales bacterium]